jgi:hypothetical protein
MDLWMGPKKSRLHVTTGVADQHFSPSSEHSPNVNFPLSVDSGLGHKTIDTANKIPGYSEMSKS